MPGLLAASTVGMTGSASTPLDPRHNELDAIMDLSLPEEQELPFATIATTTAVPVGENMMEDEGDQFDKIAVFNMDSKVHFTYIDKLCPVGVAACADMRVQLTKAIRGSQRM